MIETRKWEKMGTARRDREWVAAHWEYCRGWNVAEEEMRFWGRGGHQGMAANRRWRVEDQGEIR